MDIGSIPQSAAPPSPSPQQAREPRRADAAAGELEHGAVLDDGNTEVDAVGVRAEGARDGELARAEGREEVEDVLAGNLGGAELVENFVDALVWLLAVFVEVVLRRTIVFEWIAEMEGIGHARLLPR